MVYYRSRAFSTKLRELEENSSGILIVVAGAVSEQTRAAVSRYTFSLEDEHLPRVLATSSSISDQKRWLPSITCPEDSNTRVLGFGHPRSIPTQQPNAPTVELSPDQDIHQLKTELIHTVSDVVGDHHVDEKYARLTLYSLNDIIDLFGSEAAYTFTADIASFSESVNLKTFLHYDGCPTDDFITQLRDPADIIVHLREGQQKYELTDADTSSYWMDIPGYSDHQDDGLEPGSNTATE